MLFGLLFIIALQQTSATPITSADPFTRAQEDKLQKALEEQQAKEMASGKRLPPPNPQDTAMLSDMEKQLDKLKAAAAKNSYKDVESQSGKLVSNLKFFIPGIDNEAIKTIPLDELAPTVDKLTPRAQSVIQSIKDGVIHLNDARAVMTALRSIQQTAKEKHR